jgi:scyllo-inositol 2-dehydrogenase (NADP+)
MIRIATVGTGAITASFVDAVSRTQGVRLAVVHSRDARRAAELAARWGARPVTSFAALLEADDVDAVYLASPNALHVVQAEAAIAAGKHVLVEKPAALSAPEWMRLVAAARAAGVVVLEAMRTAYDPGFAEVRRLLPELGAIRRASLRFESRSARYDRVLAGEQVNVFDPAMGGGALRDLGVYGLFAMVALFGEPDDVSGRAVEVASGAPGAGIVVARYPGLVVDVSYSKITRSLLASEIQGEDATLTVDRIASPRRLVVSSADGSREIDVPGPADVLDGEVARFAHLVRTGDSAERDHEATRVTLALIDRVA